MNNVKNDGDAFIYKTICKNDDCQILQNDLNNLVKWEKLWSMEFHTDKCKVLCINNKQNTTNFTYSMDKTDLETIKEAKYLGINMHRKLA